MENMGVNEFRDWQQTHVGIVVKDVKATLEYYKKLGIFYIPSMEPFVSEGKTAGVYGAWVYFGGYGMEIFSPKKGEIVQKHFLENHGEGLNHVAFRVQNLTKTREQMAKLGIKELFRPAPGASYYDIREVGNVLLELIGPVEPTR